MDDRFVKTCVICNTEKRVDNFYRKYSECKECNIERILKRYYNFKDEILQKNIQINSFFS